MSAGCLPLVGIPDFIGAEALFVLVAALVFALFLVTARLVARSVRQTLSRRGMRPEMVTIGSRVITFSLIGMGALFAFGIAVQSSNVTLAGIVGATIIASFGVQDLLKDYVSGYYVLLERHIRVGDHITVEGWTGRVTEVRLRVTLLKGDDGDLVVVPNSELFNRPVTIRRREVGDQSAG